MTDDACMPFRSPAMVELTERLERLREMDAKTASPCNVVIQGETGAGKDLIARRIHALSGRGDAPFVALNCSAVPGELFESELFGHERGAFTSAVAKKKGLLEEARGGTLFLDEVGDLPIALQVKLLRALQNKVIRHVGGLKDIEIDVRVIVATNRDLRELVDAGAFRRDLYYRLHVFSVTVPPLRERAEDIPELVSRFCGCCAEKYGVPRKTVADEVIAAFRAYDWPGNVRELEHVIEYAYIMCREDVIGLADVAEKLGDRPVATASRAPVASGGTSTDARTAVEHLVMRLDATVGWQAFTDALDHAKAMYCMRHLDEHGGNISRAARATGIDRRGMYRILHRAGFRMAVDSAE